ncbi:peptide ABC transporter permease [Neobacillus ginsengisoli]|uniref:Peptide/nickel transport system permease protein n=1 Tax=Neobacillus ginsengisoli TaxID=904295 RepID=A0ABT9XT23_9BACI|nr:peptide ABC transporter permease [Neobacillus ginsengisoli]MDQ0198709.1 peptide/nickel transport system permease protein [Neobacillus ginsengisoli]
MVLFLLKKKRFLFGFLFLATLLTLSIFNTVNNHGKIEQIRFHTDKKGNLLDAPPYPPFTLFVFGSDKEGFNLGQLIVEGAKYTIGITIVVSILRMLFSLIISGFIYTLRPAFYKLLKTIFEPFSIVPQTIIAYFILYSVLWLPMAGFQHPFWQRALFETTILVIIAIPNLTIHLSNEMRIVKKEPFIEASKTLGAGNGYIFFKHIVVHLHEKWILLFGQQFLQVLQLLAHLGFLKLFFGGSIVEYGLGSGPPTSASHEWAGLIGSNISYLYFQQWIILVPIGFFILTSISVFFVNDSLKEYFQMKDTLRYKKAELFN